jgi:hypothetical protein
MVDQYFRDNVNLMVIQNFKIYAFWLESIQVVRMAMYL